MHLNNILIETDRLLLKPLSYDYTEEMIKKYTLENKKYKEDDVLEKSKTKIEKYIKNITEGIDLHMVIIKKDSNDFIGFMSLYRINTLEPELEIWTKKTFRKNGYGLETMNGLLKWAYKNIKFDYIIYSTGGKIKQRKKLQVKDNYKRIKETKIVENNKSKTKEKIKCNKIIME